jgi:spermidine synthase
MAGLRKIRSVLEFHEVDKDQGVERNYLYYKDSSYHVHTEKQNVDIIESALWGKMLFLDGVLQSTTQDEIIYHTALVHTTLNAADSRKDILILGGGEGSTAREVLRWPDVEHVTMVDYDKELVDALRKHGPEWSMGAFEDPRLDVIYEDAWIQIQKEADYGAVIVDLTDPNPKRDEWEALLNSALKRVEKKRGPVIMNAGLYTPWKTDNLKEILTIAQDVCKANPLYKFQFITVNVPSFNGDWTFCLFQHTKGNRNQNPLISLTLHGLPDWIRRMMRSLQVDYITNPPSAKPSIGKLDIATRVI